MDSSSDRFVLHDKVRQVLGTREGDILMEHLPPAGWSHLASKDDIALARVVLREEMAELRTELKAEMADLRSELRNDMASLRTELKTEMADLRSELKTEIAELRSEMERGFRSQTWRLMGAVISSNAAMIAAMGFMVSSLQ